MTKKIKIKFVKTWVIKFENSTRLFGWFVLNGRFSNHEEYYKYSRNYYLFWCHSGGVLTIKQKYKSKIKCLDKKIADNPKYRLIDVDLLKEIDPTLYLRAHEAFIEYKLQNS